MEIRKEECRNWMRCVWKEVLAGGKLDIRSVDDFEKALLADMRKDFYGEGQVFYQFKRLRSRTFK